MNCIICHGKMEEAAILLWEKAICPLCEGQIVSAQPEDDDYDEIVASFRVLWQEHFFSAVDHHLWIKDDEM